MASKKPPDSDTHINDIISRIDPKVSGKTMVDLMSNLFPICRSITGRGVLETFAILRNYIDLRIHEVPTGYQAYDWVVPKEWNIRDAYIKNKHGERVIDFNQSNLHVVNYSAPISATMPLDQLKPHLHTKPDMPNAIPYVTSYYKEQWGFCLTQNQLDELPEGEYEILIDSSLTEGKLTYADAILPGKSEEEILLSTYVCHPSLANDNLSGPALTSLLYQILAQTNLRYTYRFVFVPETLGTLVYLSKHDEHIGRNLHAGYVVTCVGNSGPYTYKRSRQGNSIADKVAEHCLKHVDEKETINVVDFFPLGSDERQYCSPGFNFPVGSLMRSMYGTYPEYHTSLDNMEFVSKEGLASSLKVYARVVQIHELNKVYINPSPYGEPHLSKHGIYPTIGGQKEGRESVERTMYLLAYADGINDLVDIANLANQPAWAFTPEVEALTKAGLLRIHEENAGR